MKKLFVLAFLGHIAIAQIKPPPPADQPDEIFAFSWAKGTVPYQHIYPMIWSYLSDPKSAAVESQKLPAGRRSMIIPPALYYSIISDPGDNCIDPKTSQLTKYHCPWLFHGMTMLRPQFDQFFKTFSVSGGHVDHLTLDSELGMSMWGGDVTLEHFTAINADARYGADLLPKFTDMAPSLDYTSTAFASDLSAGWHAANDPYVNSWNEMMADITGCALREIIFKPLRKYFPMAGLSDYSVVTHSKSWDLIDSNGWNYSLFGHGVLEGTHLATVLYGGLGAIVYTKPDGVNYYQPNVFNALKLDLNALRATQLMNLPTSPWIAFKSYTGSLYAKTDYYQEMMLHAGLTGVDFFLYWNPKDVNSTDQDDQTTERTLEELNRLIGFKHRKTLVTKQIGWGDDYILTGMTVNGFKLWRFTPQTGATSCNNSTKGLICIFGSKTITFLEASQIPSNVSLLGVWVKQSLLAPLPVLGLESSLSSSSFSNSSSSSSLKGSP